MEPLPVVRGRVLAVQEVDLPNITVGLVPSPEFLNVQPEVVEDFDFVRLRELGYYIPLDSM